MLYHAVDYNYRLRCAARCFVSIPFQYVSVHVCDDVWWCVMMCDVSFLFICCSTVHLIFIGFRLCLIIGLSCLVAVLLFLVINTWVGSSALVGINFKRAAVSYRFVAFLVIKLKMVEYYRNIYEYFTWRFWRSSSINKKVFVGLNISPWILQIAFPSCKPITCILHRFCNGDMCSVSPLMRKMPSTGPEHQRRRKRESMQVPAVFSCWEGW